jgi:hypothetical protein
MFIKVKRDPIVLNVIPWMGGQVIKPSITLLEHSLSVELMINYLVKTVMDLTVDKNSQVQAQNVYLVIEILTLGA